MPDNSVDSPRRRKLLATVGASAVAYGAGVGATAAQTMETVEARLNNIGASAWEVTSTTDDELAETGVGNPELSLRVGTRYTFQNNGWSAHPLALRGPDGEVLLSQDEQGSFEGDSETDWVDNETSVSFTVTSELADELDNYICTIHSSMEGSIRTIQESTSDAPADVTMSDQSTDGTSVVVDSARLDNGGFVTIHDSSLNDGAALESVRGTSEYLEPGSVQNLEIELDKPLASGDTLIAMAHRDSNDNETYDFVSSGADADGPYTFDGGAVVDDADVQVNTAATVRINDQSTGGASVTVDYARLDDGGFVTIHDSTLQDGDPLGSVRGTSAYLDSGSVSDLTVELDEPLEEDDTLIAMPHRDSNDNETYDFVSSEGGADGPYASDGGAIVDDADVQVGGGAAAQLRDQSTDGTTVTVEYARLDEGGFVTIHDSTLLDGDPLGSVRGTSESLDSGSVEDLTVELDEPLEEDDTLIAMPHRDSNDNETYDFVESEGGADGPYSFDGGAVTDRAEVQVVGEAATLLSDQTIDGDTVVVDYTRVDSGGFVTIHDSTLLDGDALGSVRGTSEYLESGSIEDLEVELDEPLEEDDTLIAMPHRDSNDNETYDFVSSEGGADGPYSFDGGAVTDSAEITVEGMDNEDGDDMDGEDGGDMDGEDGDDMDNTDGEDGSDGEDGGDSSDGSGPGFGPVAGAAGLSGLAAYAYRKLNLDSDPATPKDDNLDEETE